MDREVRLLPKILFGGTLLGLAWAYGVAAHMYGLFPQPQLVSLIVKAREAVSLVLGETGIQPAWWYTKVTYPVPSLQVHQPGAVSPGLLLISGIKEDNILMAKVIDNQGNAVHEWDIDWFKLWPDPEHLHQEIRPKQHPGALIHGIVLMPNGDLIFNFERLGLIRLGSCGEVRWRLSHRTHHSVHPDDNGNLWVSGRYDLEGGETPEGFSNYLDGHVPMILEVSSNGEIKSELSVYDLLIDNGLNGLLYMSTTNNWGTRVSGDLLHLNDIEPFSENMKSGFFKPGDLLISLRNVGAVIVFNKHSKKVKYVSVGEVVRQHDPDFVDGNTISIFDNNNLSTAKDGFSEQEDGLSSRIVKLNVKTGEKTIYFSGTEQQPFFTNIMGKHQWLENGNLLITESRSGRAFEVTPGKQIAWEYQNTLNGDYKGFVGILDEVQRLPLEFDRRYFQRIQERCKKH